MYAGIAIGIVNLLTFIKVYQGSFNYLGIPAVLLYLILPVGFIFLCVSAGYADEKLKTWAAEASHSNMNLNPEMKEIVDWVREQKEREMWTKASLKDSAKWRKEYENR
jgi:hypothetical protein